MLGYTGSPDELQLTFGGKYVHLDRGWVGIVNGGLAASISDPEICSHLLSCNYEETLLKSPFDYIFFYNPEETNVSHVDISLISTVRSGKDAKLVVRFVVNPIHWKESWTPRDYIFELNSLNLSENMELSVNRLRNDTFDSFDITIDVEDKEVIRSDINYIIASLRAFDGFVRGLLTNRLGPATLEINFDFAEDIRVACQQYLVYFAQFMKDLGIPVITEVKGGARQTLFSVTPQDEKEALENIKLALDIYLHLPANPNIGYSSPTSTSIEVQRLEANIHHLHGELRLANAEREIARVTIRHQDTLLQLKDDIIQEKSTAIQQQQAFIDSLVLVKSVQKEKDDKEHVVGDIVSVKEFDWQFINVDLPTLMRRLKARFRKKPVDDDTQDT